MVTHTLPQALVELQSKKQWVCWCYEPDKNGRMTKVPYQAKNGYKASTRNPKNWVTYEDAVKAQKFARTIDGKPYDGIGFVFNNDYTGIDWDHCVNEDGTIEEWAQKDINRVATYCELSPSGTGIHGIARALLPEKPDKEGKTTRPGKKVRIPAQNHPDAATEMYCEGRFFTMTGNHLAGTPTTIEDRQKEVTAFFQELLQLSNKPTQQTQKGPIHPTDLSDHELIEKACSASNGPKFSELWYGNTNAYGNDDSAADQALCNLLAFWTGKDSARMDRLFRQSGLYRAEKWDRNARSGETYGEGTIERAIASCKEVYEKQGQWAQYSPRLDHSANGNGHQTPNNQSTQPDLETIIKRLNENEYGDGLLFAEVFNGQVCYDHSEKAWYLWNKHHWKKDATGKIKQMVSGHLGSIYLKARGDVHKQIVDVQAEVEQRQKENKEDEKLIKLNARLAYLGGLMEALEKRAKALRGANRMKNALTFAMSEHNIGVTGEIWDSDPWLLGVKNGVIDLRTGECRDGYPIDYIRSVSPTEWTGLNTPCPRFEKFLQEIFEVLPEAQLQNLTEGKFHNLPKEEQEHITAEHRKKLIDFLQRLLGYAIAGLSTEAIFPLFYGEEGRNGKDTLFKVLKFVLGIAIADAISNDVFLSTDRGRAAGAATPHLADLQGKRMVWGSETKQGDRINVSQIKQLTGGGDISARRNYGDQYTFSPTHTLFLMTNYKPHADAKDKAFWTRACLIEFTLRFVDNPQGTQERKADTNLTEDLKVEASGILAWLVRGCLDYQKQGLNRPEIVLLSTESYRASEDNIQQFIDDCCVCHESVSVGAQRLYDTYKKWCADNNLSHINGKLFGEDISRRFAKVHRRTGWEYQKIGIRTDDTPPGGHKCDGSNPTCDGSKQHPSHPYNPASEAPSDTINIPPCDGCDGLNQEVPYITPHESMISPLYGQTRHTRHTTSGKDPLEQPVEPNDKHVTGQNIPVTSGFDPSHSLEAFWSVGKKYGYPEILDLGLKSGKLEWNSFSLSRRIRIPDVIARLGGA